MTKMQKAGHKAWKTRRENEAFNKQIRALRPDWFQDSFVSRKEFQELKNSHKKLIAIVKGLLPLLQR